MNFENIVRRPNEFALEKWKEDWLNDRYRKTIQSERIASFDNSTDVDRVKAIFRIMSERERLIEMIVFEKIVTKDQNLLAVQLLTVTSNSIMVAHARIWLPQAAHAVAQSHTHSPGSRRCIR